MAAEFRRVLPGGVFAPGEPRPVPAGPQFKADLVISPERWGSGRPGGDEATLRLELRCVDRATGAALFGPAGLLARVLALFVLRARPQCVSCRFERVGTAGFYSRVDELTISTGGTAVVPAAPPG